MATTAMDYETAGGDRYDGMFLRLLVPRLLNRAHWLLTPYLEQMTVPAMIVINGAPPPANPATTTVNFASVPAHPAPPDASRPLRDVFIASRSARHVALHTCSDCFETFCAFLGRFAAASCALTSSARVSSSCNSRTGMGRAFTGPK